MIGCAGNAPKTSLVRLVPLAANVVAQFRAPEDIRRRLSVVTSGAAAAA